MKLWRQRTPLASGYFLKQLLVLLVLLCDRQNRNVVTSYARAEVTCGDHFWKRRDQRGRQLSACPDLQRKTAVFFLFYWERFVSSLKLTFRADYSWYHSFSENLDRFFEIIVSRDAVMRRLMSRWGKSCSSNCFKLFSGFVLNGEVAEDDVFRFLFHLPILSLAQFSSAWIFKWHLWVNWIGRLTLGM